MAKFKALPIAAAVAAGLLSLASGAQAADNNGWTVGGYGKFKYDIGESYSTGNTWEHRRDMRAGGPFFSANVNQVEFTLKKASEYKNGVWANYVLRTEYGNNEGGNGQPFYGSSSGNEGYGETGALEFKEAYVELGALSVLPKDGSIWAGRRFLNRQQGLISKEFWKQSSGVGAGFAMGNMGLALISADPGNTWAEKNAAVSPEGRTTLNSLDAYLYSVKLTDVMKLDFDVKYHWRANDDQLGNVGVSKSAKDGAAVGVMLSANYYGLPGWSVTALNYGEGIATNRGMNFGQWDGSWGEDDSAIFFTHNGVWTINNTFQLGTEIAYWDIDMKSKAWGTDQVERLFLGVTPSIKINDNFRLEFIATAAQEVVGDSDGTGLDDWGRDDGAWFYTATFAPVFTVNADYFGRPQIKPYVTYMTSDHDGYRWIAGADDESEVVYGVEAEIWF